VRPWTWAATRLSAEHGFTLVELLVVIVIIGILGAISIPAFLNQQNKGSDVSAKSDAKYLAFAVESCNVDTEDYAQCDSETKLGTNLSVTYGTGPGQVSVEAATKRSFRVVATSTATTGGTYHRFEIRKNQDGTTDRTCSTGTASNMDGGCNAGGW
jgi:type IV pilus assembly protein PilA